MLGREENFVGKEKMLVTSFFSNSHNVFKRLLSQGPQKSGLCCKGLNVAQMIISVFDWEENIVGRGENAGYQHFFFSHSVFQTLSPYG